jgi:hypothetical protein
MIKSEPPPKAYLFWKVYIVCLLPDFSRLTTVMVLSPRCTESKKTASTVSTVYMCDVMCVLRCAVCGVHGVSGMLYALGTLFVEKRTRFTFTFSETKRVHRSVVQISRYHSGQFFDGFQIVCLEVLFLRYTPVPYELSSHRIDVTIAKIIVPSVASYITLCTPVVPLICNDGIHLSHWFFVSLCIIDNLS